MLPVVRLARQGLGGPLTTGLRTNLRPWLALFPRAHPASDVVKRLPEELWELTRTKRRPARKMPPGLETDSHALQPLLLRGQDVAVK